jgi:hypothetical protein
MLMMMMKVVVVMMMMMMPSSDTSSLPGWVGMALGGRRGDRDIARIHPIHVVRIDKGSGSRQDRPRARALAEIVGDCLARAQNYQEAARRLYEEAFFLREEAVFARAVVDARGQI